MSVELPDGWASRPLGTIVDTIMGQSPPSSAVSADDARGLPFIQGNAEFGPRHPAPTLFTTDTPKVAAAGDILLSVRAPVGEVNVAEGALCIGRGVVALRARGCDPDFLFYAVGGLAPAFARLSQGSTFDAINGKELRQIELPLPPFNEQRRIAEVLSSVDGAIAAQSDVCDQTEVMFNSLAEACFTAREGADNIWPIYPLNDLCKSIQVGIVVRPASYYVETGGIAALRSLNVDENRLNLDELVYISAEGHRLNNKSSLRPGDVVTRRTGEPGKTAVIPPLFPDGLNCIDIIFSRPTDILRPHFLSFFMNSDIAKRQVAGLQGGLAQQHLNVGEMKKLKVPLPTLHVQDEVVATLKSAWDRVEGEKALLHRLLSLRSAIGMDLLSGRVRVPT